MECNCSVCSGNLDYTEEVCEHCGKALPDCNCRYCEICDNHWKECPCDYCEDCDKHFEYCTCEKGEESEID